jgi:hypothetical protein
VSHPTAGAATHTLGECKRRRERQPEQPQFLRRLPLAPERASEAEHAIGLPASEWLGIRLPAYAPSPGPGGRARGFLRDVVALTIRPTAQISRITNAVTDADAVILKSNIYNAPPNTSTVLRHTHFEYLKETAYTGNPNLWLLLSYAMRSKCEGNASRQSSSSFETSTSKSVLPECAKPRLGPPISPIIEHKTSD